MHQAFYRKYRPQVFDDVCGQEHITSILSHECAEGSISHAYLFCGSRGTGKTTCAKILAKAINCESPINGNPCGKCSSCRAVEDGSATDVVEMDAASNNGVDDIRILRDEVVYSPSMLKKRVYIIDEVHMLSQSAFNALLKTLEEPPEYVVFILATTEYHKLPATITSRCQRFDFRRISIEDISKRLEFIAHKENIVLAHEAAARIARIAEGGMRDAISLFELCAASTDNVDAEKVAYVLGLSGYDSMKRFAEAVSSKDLGALLSMIATTQSSSKDISVFWGEVISFWRDMMIMKVATDPGTYLDLTESQKAALYDAARLFNLNQIAYQIGILDEARQNMVRSPQARRQIAELSLLRLISPEFDKSPDSLLARIASLEDKVALLEMGVSNRTFETKGDSKWVSDTSSPGMSIDSEDIAPVDFDNGSTDDPFIKDDVDDVAAVEDTPEERVSDDDFLEIPDPGSLIEKLGSNADMYRSYLSDAKIETNTSGSVLRISVSNSFAKTILGKNDVTEQIKKAALLAKIVYEPPRVEIVLAEKDDKPADNLFFF